MGITLIIVSIIAIAAGTVLGYFIANAKSGKETGELKSNLDNERKSHGQTSQLLNLREEDIKSLTNRLQTEQQERVKFETQSTGFEKQLGQVKTDYQNAKTELSEKNQEIVIAHSQKIKAETELKEANNSISDLNTAIEKYTKDITKLQGDVGDLRTTNADVSAKYQEALKAIEEQKKFVTEANNSLREAFNSLSAQALKNNNQSFLDLAKTALETHINESKTDLDKRQQAIDSMVKPLTESLTKFDGKIQEIEVARQGAYSEIKVFLDNMKGTTEKLQKETSTLVSALKTSHVRGKYGEIGLRRVVEFAGMSQFCDFDEQSSVTTEDGRLRPDLIVKLPGQRHVIVDAKVPLAAYMQAFETTDENEKK